MAKPLKTSELIKSVRQRAMIPTNDKTFSDEDIIDILNEEMDTGIVPEVLKQHEEYYTVSEDQTLSTTTNRYKIPYRAIGNKLRDIHYVGDEGYVRELSRISLEDLADYQSVYNYGDSEVFYLEGNDVVFPSQNSGTGTLRMYFHLRPNSLVTADKAGKILGINTTTGTITLDTFPSDFSGLPLMDFIDHQSPNEIIDYDIQPVSVNTTTNEVTFNVSDIPSCLKVGDYLCKFQETVFPQIPVEMHTILAQRAAIYCLEALNDSEGLGNAQRKLDRMEKDIDTVLNNRVEGSPKKVMNRNGVLRDSVYKTGHSRRYTRRY